MDTINIRKKKLFKSNLQKKQAMIVLLVIAFTIVSTLIMDHFPDGRLYLIGCGMYAFTQYLAGVIMRAF